MPEDDPTLGLLAEPADRSPTKALRQPACFVRLRSPGGEMAEWFKAHAWKACVANNYRGFESLSLRQFQFCLNLKPGIDGFTFERQDSEDTLMHPAEWLATDKTFERFHS